MTDAFISYSRRNAEFVKKLNQSLNDLGRDIWVDWEDILPTTDWLQEIYRAIEQTENFVFVISPDSLASEYCMLELNYAVEHGKRIFPLFHKKADISNYPSLSRHQYIMFDGSIPFEKGMEQLTTALDTNLEWVRFHTDLLKRALHWQEQGYETSYNLHGQELKEAREWLGQVKEDWDPQPTPLQNNYVVQSRKAKKTRRRNYILSAMAILIFAGLAIFGFVESKLASDQARISTAYLIGAKADQSTEPDLALLLSLHAVDVLVDEQTRATLFSNFSRFSELRRIIYGTEENVIDVLFNHDHTQVITLEENEEISIWDINSNELVHEFNLENNEDNPFIDLALHPYQDILAASLEEEIIMIFDIEAQSQIATFTFPELIFTKITFSPDGSQIAAAAGESLIVIDSESGVVLFEAAVSEENAILSIAYNLDGNLLAAGGENGVVHLWDLPKAYNYSFLEILGEADVNAVTFGSEPNVLFTAGRDITIRAWDVITKELITEAPFEQGHTAPVYALDYDPNSNFIVSAGEDLKIQVWVTIDNKILLVKSLTGHTNFINAVNFSDDGLLIVSGSLAAVNIWEAELKPPGTLLGHASSIFGLATNADQNMIFSAGDEGQVIAWDQWDGKVISQIFIPGLPALVDIDADKDGNLVVLGGEDGKAYLWEPHQNSILNTFDFEDSITSVSLSPDGTKVAIGGYYNNLTLWDYETGKSWEVAWDYGDDGDQVSDIIFHPTKNWVVASWWSGHVLIWDIDSGEIIREIKIGEGGYGPPADLPEPEFIEEEEEEDDVEKALSLAFNEDGTMLFIGSSHGAIHFWSYSDEDTDYFSEGAVEEHSSWVNSLDYDANQNRLVSTGEDSLIIVWDLNSNDILSSMRGDAGGIPSAVFFDGGDMIASGDRNGDIILWMIDPDEVSDKICKIVNRSLTLDEWERVITEQDYFSDACAKLGEDE